MLLSTLFLVCWILVPLIWFGLLRLSSISLLEISIPAVLFWFILVFGYLGYPILWFGLDPYRNDVIVDPLIILEMFSYSIAAITSLLFGFFFARLIFGPLRVTDALSKSFLKISPSIESLQFLSFFLFCLCLYALFLYIDSVGLDRLGLLVALDLVSSSSDVTALRSEASNALSNYHWYRVFTADLLLFCTFCFGSIYFYKTSFLRTCVFFFAAATSAFSLTLSGEKAQIMELLIGLFLLYSVRNNGGRLALRDIVKFSLASLVVIAPIYYFMMGSSSLSEALWQVGSRILTGQLHPGYVYLEYFPEHREFLFGATFPNPGSVFPYEPVTITQEIMAWDNPEEYAQGIIGSMPAMFWVESYVNFGAASIPFLSAGIGIFLYSINWCFFRFRFNPLFVSFYVWIVLFYKDLALSFFSDFFINLYLFSTLFVFSVFYIVCYRGKIAFARG